MSPPTLLRESQSAYPGGLPLERCLGRGLNRCLGRRLLGSTYNISSVFLRSILLLRKIRVYCITVILIVVPATNNLLHIGTEHDSLQMRLDMAQINMTRQETYMFELGGVGALDIAKRRVILDNSSRDKVVQLYTCQPVILSSFIWVNIRQAGTSPDPIGQGNVCTKAGYRSSC
jgi:hypothetical protein